MWFPNRSDTNQPVQSQKRARSLKFRIQVEEELYYLSSENKGVDQLRGYREADLRLCFRLCRLLVLHAEVKLIYFHLQNDCLELLFMVFSQRWCMNLPTVMCDFFF